MGMSNCGAGAQAAAPRAVSPARAIPITVRAPADLMAGSAPRGAGRVRHPDVECEKGNQRPRRPEHAEEKTKTLVEVYRDPGTVSMSFQSP
jgi:hypothetical protein